MGSCYEHVAAELLRKLEGLQRTRSKLYHKILHQLLCICDLEQRSKLTLAHPQLVRQRHETPSSSTQNAAQNDHCRHVLNALASASLQNKPVPYWSVVSGAQATIAPPSVTNAVAQWRSHLKRSSVMVKKVIEQPRLPGIGTSHWMLTTPMQKLEQLGTQLVLARGAKHATLVVVGTEYVAVYLGQLLNNIQDQGYMSLGTIVAITPEMTFQEVLDLATTGIWYGCA